MRASGGRQRGAAALAVSLLGLGAPSGCRAPEPGDAAEIGPSWTPADAATPLGHEDCVRLAATWAPDAASWEARRAAAAAELSQAKKLPNPELALGFENFPLGGAAAALESTASLGYSLAQLATRGTRSAAARAELAAVEADYRAELLALGAAVRSAYDDLVAARRRTALQREAEDLREADRDAVTRFVQRGERAPVVLEQAEADLVEAHAARAAAESEERTEEIALAFALGFERPLPLELADPLTEPAAAPAGPQALEALLGEAASARPEIAAATARYDAERERLHLAADRARFLPSVGFGPRLTEGDLLGVASLDVELPLFDAGTAAREAQEARLLASAAEIRQEAHAVGREVATAAFRVAAAERALEDQARVAAARRTLSGRAETLFRAGEIDYFELSSARRDELAARLALLEVERDAAGAAVALDAALGRRAPATAP